MTLESIFMPPPDFELQRARDLHKNGQLDDAMTIYYDLLARNPNDPDAHHLLGVALFQRGELPRAEQEIRLALAQKRDDPNYFYNLANVLLAQGKPAKALDIFTAALDLNPEHIESLMGGGSILFALGRLEEAEDLFRKIVALDPHHHAALNNLGVILARTDRPAEAVTVFKIVIRDADAAAEVFSNLARALEMLNELADARQMVSRALAKNPGLVSARLVHCHLFRREGKLTEARAAYENLLRDTLPPPEKVGALYGYGLTLDQLFDPEAAFAAFNEANKTASDTSEFKQRDGRRYLKGVEACRNWFTRDIIEARSLPSDDQVVTPVFFVGFPRSGTTLMEQILAAHPDVVTTAEKSPLQHVRQNLVRRFGTVRSFPEFLDELSPKHLEGARDLFWQDAERLVDLAPHAVLIDKLPLNIVDLGFANLLFPDAKVVVALRDPRDVCLSCFMQDFGASDAMANFLDIKTTDKAYASVMGLWGHYKEVLTLPFMEYRYEDLVENFHHTTHRIIDFIGLSWSEDIEHYREQAASRFIATPSYRDVTSQLYTRASGRWRRYEKYLAGQLPEAYGLAAKFGYEP